MNNSNSNARRQQNNAAKMTSNYSYQQAPPQGKNVIRSFEHQLSHRHSSDREPVLMEFEGHGDVYRGISNAGEVQRIERASTG